MRDAFIVFPVHLFESTAVLSDYDAIYIVEEPAYFTRLPFHKLKLIYHRATLKYYKDYLDTALRTAAKQTKKSNGITAVPAVHYIEYSDIASFYAKELQKYNSVAMYDPCDHELLSHMNRVVKKATKNPPVIHDNKSFIFSKSDMDDYRKSIQKRNGDEPRHYMHDASFYKWARRRTGLLMTNSKDKDGDNALPLYDKWSFDKENRNPFPRDYKEDNIFVYKNAYYDEARRYIERNFPNNFGDTDNTIYPITYAECNKFITKFIEKKLTQFGAYQDAISAKAVIGYHSALSPLLNTGLVTPDAVIDKVTRAFNKLDNKEQRKILPSVEGFIRQIIGWREYIRLVYHYHGAEIKTMNYFDNNNKVPAGWYSSTTGLEIADNCIDKARRYAYLHHIERLMVMGNFGLFLEISPAEIYKWFMICFIDSYEWVMLPNVWGMSQYALEGMSMTNRPYICSSRYLLKMSDYKRGEWADVWDALFYNFIDKKSKNLKKYRTYLFVKMWNNMDKNRKKLLKALYREYNERYLT